MNDVKWIKITTDMFDNRKIRAIRKLPEGNNIILIWVMLLSLAGRCNASGMIFLTENIPYTNKMLADELDFEESVICIALDTLEKFGMITRDENLFISVNNWAEYQSVEGMDKIREQTKKRVTDYRRRQKENNVELLSCNVTCNVTETLQKRNVTQQNKNKNKDIEKENNNISCASEMHDDDDLEGFFNSIWKLYPIKKGKGQVSKTKKKVLRRKGYDQIERCVNRFIADMEDEGRDRRYWMHGSTFFNSGYVDYLDENYLTGNVKNEIPDEKSPEVEELEFDEELLDGEEIIDWSKMTDDEFEEYLRVHRR